MFSFHSVYALRPNRKKEDWRKGGEEESEVGKQREDGDAMEEGGRWIATGLKFVESFLVRRRIANIQMSNGSHWPREPISAAK